MKRIVLSIVAAGLVMGLASGCRRETTKASAATTTEPPEPATPAAPAEPAPPEPPPAPPGLAPLAAAATDALSVPGHADAVLAAPAGITKPVPVVVAVLGIGDTPESQCATWRELVGARAFVLCPRGLPHYVKDEGLISGGAVPDPSAPSREPTESSGHTGKLTQVGYYVADVPSLEREIDAGLAALRAQHGPYVAAGPVLYVGFSRGAFLGASLVGKAPHVYERAVLIEGGQSAWTNETARSFAANGGKRVLFACGRPSCVDESKDAAALLARSEVDTKVVYGEGEGHDYQHQVKDQLRASLDWVLEGDPAWSATSGTLTSN
ncbi:MAG: uncharacterized protein JWP97_729 [Labilithrix sp.]|nr:uncharacterized protein [Labilithrix sp.]